MTSRRIVTVLAGITALALSALRAGAQWVQQHETYYLQAPHNWEFRDRYQAADRLFNAFDYGHAILYETLWRWPQESVNRLEREEYEKLTRKILVKPPRLPLEEGAIEIAYARLAPEAKAMFEWAHILHRQIYDVWADEEIPVDQKDRYVAEVLAHYRSRPDVAFSTRPKSMALMQEQPYSLAFRQRYPKFNGLIWAYHWLQVGLYEPLLVGRTVEERQALVRATVARFWQMLERPVGSMPHQMPMTAAVAPVFAARYPEAAIIFDNLHSMHDVISDILANAAVPRDRKRAEILRAARLYRDDTSYVMPVAAWRTMSQHMGVENMGGPSVGFVPELPTPTVTYGAVMTHDERTGAMTGFTYGSATGDAHAGHAAMGHGAHSVSDSSAVAAVVAAYHNALASGDSTAVMTLLAADARILESGTAVTRDAYRSRHLAADMQRARAAASDRGPVQVTVRGDVAWAALGFRTSARGESRGPVESESTELIVLSRERDGWKIRAIHRSSRRGDSR